MDAGSWSMLVSEAGDDLPLWLMGRRRRQQVVVDGHDNPWSEDRGWRRGKELPMCRLWYGGTKRTAGVNGRVWALTISAHGETDGARCDTGGSWGRNDGVVGFKVLCPTETARDRAGTTAEGKKQPVSLALLYFAGPDRRQQEERELDQCHLLAMNRTSQKLNKKRASVVCVVGCHANGKGTERKHNRKFITL